MQTMHVVTSARRLPAILYNHTLPVTSLSFSGLNLPVTGHWVFQASQLHPHASILHLQNPVVYNVSSARPRQPVNRLQRQMRNQQCPFVNLNRIVVCHLLYRCLPLHCTGKNSRGCGNVTPSCLSTNHSDNDTIQIMYPKIIQNLFEICHCLH